MGILNDVVIMVDGKADIKTHDHVPTLLRKLRAVAVDVDTVSDAGRRDRTKYHRRRGSRVDRCTYLSGGRCFLLGG